MEEGTLSFTNTLNALAEYREAIVYSYGNKLLDNDHFSSGKLADSLLKNLDYEIQVGENKFEVSLSLEDYWKYVEYDTPAHWPPINKILDWIKVKPVIPYSTYDGKLPTQEQLAFLIGRSIAGESPNQSELKNPHGGTIGTHDLERTLDELNDEYMVKISEAVTKDVSDAVAAILSGLC